MHSRTLYNATRDTGSSTQSVLRIMTEYTPRSMTCGAPQCHDFVVQFVAKWAAKCDSSRGGKCGMPLFESTPSWQTLLATYARHPRRAILDKLWRAAHADSGVCGCVFQGVHAAADFWDVPCLYWHTTYLMYERCGQPL